MVNEDVKQQIRILVEKYNTAMNSYSMIFAEFAMRDLCAPYRFDSEYKGDYYLISERKINNYYSTVIERESIAMGLYRNIDYKTTLIITGKTPLRQYFNKNKYYIILTNEYLVAIKRRKTHKTIPFKKVKEKYISIKSLFCITKMKEF